MKIPVEAQETLFRDAIDRDRTTARRKALLEILYHERYLTREQLIARVDGILGRGCFGDAAWKDTFYRDIKIVKAAFKAAGYRLSYSRSQNRPGYYLHGQPAIGDDLSAVLGGSVAEVDSRQLSIFKTRTFAQRFQQGCSISDLACQVVTNRIRQRTPGISVVQAQRQALQESAT